MGAKIRKYSDRLRKLELFSFFYAINRSASMNNKKFFFFHSIKYFVHKVRQDFTLRSTTRRFFYVFQPINIIQNSVSQAPYWHDTNAITACIGITAIGSKNHEERGNSHLIRVNLFAQCKQIGSTIFNKLVAT